MNDTDTVDQPSCCMRKNPTYKQQVYDGVHANVALSAVYLAAYAAGFKFMCLGSFLSLILNSLYIWSIWDKAYGVEEVDSLNSSMESDENTDSADYDTNLSLKQREHGATLPRAMDEEDEIILNSKFQRVVEETRKRNEARRLNTIPRTPTNSSLNEVDEYADMPPLISMDYSNIAAINPRCAACIHHYNNLIPVNPLTYNIYDEITSPSIHISTVRELVTPSKTNALHGMDEVD
jgi:hypothetical protein